MNATAGSGGTDGKFLNVTTTARAQRGTDQPGDLGHHRARGAIAAVCEPQAKRSNANGSHGFGGRLSLVADRRQVAVDVAGGAVSTPRFRCATGPAGGASALLGPTTRKRSPAVPYLHCWQGSHHSRAA